MKQVFPQWKFFLKKGNQIKYTEWLLCVDQNNQICWTQYSKFALAVSKCRGFCWGISPFYSICLGNKNAESVKFLEIKKKIVFLELKKKFFVKEKKISFIKKTLFPDTSYSCASIFIIQTFILYIFNSSAWNRYSSPETLLCYALNEVMT